MYITYVEGNYTCLAKAKVSMQKGENVKADSGLTRESLDWQLILCPFPVSLKPGFASSHAGGQRSPASAAGQGRFSAGLGGSRRSPALNSETEVLRDFRCFGQHFFPLRLPG